MVSSPKVHFFFTRLSCAAGRSIREWSGVEEISGVFFLGRRVWTCPGRIQCVQYHKCVYGERRAGTGGTLSHSCLAILILHISRRTSMGHILQRRRTHLFRSNKAEGLAGYFIINNYEFICWRNRCQRGIVKYCLYGHLTAEAE